MAAFNNKPSQRRGPSPKHNAHRSAAHRPPAQQNQRRSRKRAQRQYRPHRGAPTTNAAGQRNSRQAHHSIFALCKTLNPKPCAHDAETTLFVSHIPNSLSNEHMHSILEQLGLLTSWNRLKDTATDKWKKSGFVTYRGSSSACRALRLLSNISIMNQTLLVNCDKNTKERLRKYKEQKLRDFAKLRHWRDNHDLVTQDDINAFLHIQQEEDRGIQQSIQNIVNRINKATQESTVSTQLAVESSVHRFLMGGSHEETEEKKSMLSHEIRRFRQMERERNEGIMKRERMRQKEQERYRQKILSLASKYEQERNAEEERRNRSMKHYKEKRHQTLKRKEDQRAEALKRKRDEFDADMSAQLKKRIMREERPYYYGNKELPEERKEEEPSEADSSPKEVADGKNVAPSELMPAVVHAKSTALQEEEAEASGQDTEQVAAAESTKAAVLPSDNDELFKLEVNWKIVHEYNLLARMKGFLEKTVEQLLGSQEATLIDFSLALLEEESSAEQLKSELDEVLSEEDLNDFVGKVWRELLRMQSEVQAQDA